jgi:hypothetical protein
MKQFRILAVAISLIVSVAMLVGCGESETVTFPDENLEAAVRDALGKALQYIVLIHTGAWGWETLLHYFG